MKRILRDADLATRHNHVATAEGPTPLVRDTAISYAPILDVARGVPAGFQVAADTTWSPEVLGQALTAFETLPPNTFMSIPVPLERLRDQQVRAALQNHGNLAGIVLDVTHFTPTISASTEAALQEIRGAGALLSVGGHEEAQPELGSIVRLRPSIVRLGRAWIDGLDQSPTKRAAIEVTGRLTAQLDAWLLAESVESAAELRALSELGVPLAQGTYIGAPKQDWPQIEAAVSGALPTPATPTTGTLRSLIRQAYTTCDATAAQAVLPEASGFESVMVIDDTGRPVSLLSRGTYGRWEPTTVMTVNIDTPVAEALSRGMSRPPETRFTPLVCTDAAGRFVGILKIEDLIGNLTV